MRLFHITWLVLVLFCAFLFVAYENLPELISKSLSKKFNVPVQVADIDYAYALADIPFFELKKVEISNPQGAILPKAFSCNGMVFKAPYTRYFDRQIVIQNLIISQPYFSFEFESLEKFPSNWAVLMENLKKSIDKSLPKDRSVLIEKLVLHNIETDLVYKSEGNQVESLPFIREILLTDIRGSGSTVTNNILSIVFQNALEAVLKAHPLKTTRVVRDKNS